MSNNPRYPHSASKLRQQQGATELSDADERLTKIARTLIKDHPYYENDARTGAALEYSSVGGLLMLMCAVPRPDAEAAVQRALETLENPRTGAKRRTGAKLLQIASQIGFWEVGNCQ